MVNIASTWKGVIMVEFKEDTIGKYTNGEISLMLWRNNNQI